MSTSPPTRKGPRNTPFEDRGAAPDAEGAALNPLKELLGRSLGLERRDGQLHVALADRKRPPPEEQTTSLSQLRAELRERLLAQVHDYAPEVMRHLVFVHDELGRKGWAGVEALPERVIGKALVQAEMLASQDPTPALATIIERLQFLQVAVQMRQDLEPPVPELVPPQQDPDPQLLDLDNFVAVEVSETTYEDFEMERSWIGTVPGGMRPPERGT